MKLLFCRDIATSVCMGNNQNIQTIIRPCRTYIKIGEVFNPNTNVRGHFCMFVQHSKHPNQNSTVQNVCI